MSALLPFRTASSSSSRLANRSSPLPDTFTRDQHPDLRADFVMALPSAAPPLVAEVLPRALAPLAEPEAQPDAFYQGLRLAAVDGTSHNLRNTPAMTARAFKSRCRGRGG